MLGSVKLLIERTLSPAIGSVEYHHTSNQSGDYGYWSNLGIL